jgi:hypothetical protein
MSGANIVMQVTFCLVFFYAALGFRFFGKVTTRPRLTTLCRQGLRFTALPVAQRLNLNGSPSGLVLMVQLLIVNNWM